MKLASRMASISRIAWNTGRSCSPISVSRCADSFAISARGRVHGLARRLEHARHRVLRQPLDVEVGAQPAQFAGDREVALGVAEADRARHVERSRPVARARAHKASLGRLLAAAEEVAQQQVERHRVAEVWSVARPLEA